MNADHPLRICLLSYRGNPYCGGQGVYIQHLSHALARLGHQVDVLSGPPYPHLNNGTCLHCLESLDLYNPDDLFRRPTLAELLNPINLMEWLGVSTMGFPEPMTFGFRARRYLKRLHKEFDIIHDNQSLSYGIWALARNRPLVATIHHPVTIDRDEAVKEQPTFLKKLKQLRWYSFIGMQKRVAPALPRIITMSQSVKRDIGQVFKIPHPKIDVIPNGIDTDKFHPLPEVARIPFRFLVTTSADVPMKGLRHLLVAMARLASTYPALHLVVVGHPDEKNNTLKLIRDLGISRRVQFTGHISQEMFVRLYAQSWAAVVPSIYEGFGLPAGEAMACGVPVISTTGGALPELLGHAGLLVPPGDPTALARAITHLCDRPDLARRLGNAGRQRILSCFTWEKAARKTVETYYRAIDDHYRFKAAGTARTVPHP